MGDAITQNWPLASSASQSQTTIIVTTGTALNFAQFADNCVSGCTPNALQTEAPSNKRLVLLIGEFDALNLCGGVADTNFSYNLGEIVKAAQSLFGLDVWIGTVPPIYSPATSALVCQTETATINQQIAAVAAADGAYLIDFASVLTSSAEVNLLGKYESSGGLSYLPSTAGYAAMTSLYSAENQ
jgi:hypothetical protein